MSFDKNIEAAIRLLNIPTAAERKSIPPQLRRRVLDALPEVSRGKAQNKQNALAATVVLGLGACVFATSRYALTKHHASPPHPTPSIYNGYAAYQQPNIALIEAVKSAVARAGTGHLIGSETGYGKPQHLEVWWQREPFFYWEQCGNETVIDDGTTQTYFMSHQALPKSTPSLNGLVIIRSSIHKGTFTSGDRMSTLLSVPDFIIAPASGAPSSGSSSGPQTSVSTAQSKVFKKQKEFVLEDQHKVTFTSSVPSETMTFHDLERLTAESSTNLPKTTETSHNYFLPSKDTKQAPKSQEERAMFQFEYNKALPATVKTFTIPKGYAIIDLEPKSHRPSLARFQATVTARDMSDDVALKLRLIPQPGSLLAIAQEFPRLVAINDIKCVGVDEKGWHYLAVDKPAIKRLSAMSEGNGDSLAIQLVPQEPMADGTPPPKQITLNVTVTFGVRAGLTGASAHALTESISLPLSLPRREPAPSSMNSEEIDVFRARYYFSQLLSRKAPSGGSEAAPKLGSSQRVPTNRDMPGITMQAVPVSEANIRARIAYWYRRAEAEANRTGASERAKAYERHALHAVHLIQVPQR